MCGPPVMDVMGWFNHIYSYNYCKPDFKTYLELKFATYRGGAPLCIQTSCHIRLFANEFNSHHCSEVKFSRNSADIFLGVSSGGYLRYDLQIWASLING